MMKIIRAEEAVIEANETYLKQTCRNRCTIYGPNGKQTLTIPVNRVNGNHTLVKDVRIAYDQPWQQLHWRSIETAYNNSPFFLYYKDDLVPFFQYRYDFLIDFNSELLLLLFKLLKTKSKIIFSEGYSLDNCTDQREMQVSKKSEFHNPPYIQPFAFRWGFITNLSIIDVLFNLGPETVDYLMNLIN